MKTYFDIEKAEADMRQVCDAAQEAARKLARTEVDRVFLEAQHRFSPANIAIASMLLQIINEGMDEGLATEVLAAVVANLIFTCDSMTNGHDFMGKLASSMRTFNTPAFPHGETSIKAEPLS